MAEALDQYEIDLRIYDGVEGNFLWYQNYFQTQREDYFNKGIEGSVTSKVISYFFGGMENLVKADSYFWKGDFKSAVNEYTKSLREFSLFKSSRGASFKLDLLTLKNIHWVKGMIALSRALQMPGDKKSFDYFSEALLEFNNEVNQSTEMKEEISMLVSFSRASLTEALLWQARGNQVEIDNSAEAKRRLMKARSAVRQAQYINKLVTEFTESIEENLDNLTRKRILVKADKLAVQGTIASEKSDYLSAKQLFIQSNLFYNRAAQLAESAGNRRILLSMSKVMEASIFECDANEMYRKNNNLKEAQLKFDEGSLIIDKAIALLGSLGSSELRDSFTAQRDYYSAMALYCKATQSFDEEIYDEAKELYLTAKDKFLSAIQLGKKSQNTTIVELTGQALAEVESYLQLCDTFL